MITSTPPNRSAIDLTFQQKSIGVSLVVIVATAIAYSVQLFKLIEFDDFLLKTAMPDAYWQLAASALVLFIAVEAVLQIVLVIGVGRVPSPSKQERTDAETNANRATRNAYVVLTFGVVMTIIGFSLATTPFVLANGLLYFFVIAEIVRLASQLIYYRQL